MTDADQAAEILRQFADAHDEHHAVRHYEHGVLVGWAPLINIAEFITGGLRKTLTTEHLRTVVEDRDRLASTVTALTQTIRAYPDAVANDAANLAHARAQRDRLAARVAELEAERELPLPAETPFTEDLACNLMMMPSLGAARAAVTVLDTRDGQIVALSGVYLGTGMRRVAETPNHPLYNELTVKVALVDPAPGEDVPYPVAADTTSSEETT